MSLRKAAGTAGNILVIAQAAITIGGMLVDLWRKARRKDDGATMAAGSTAPRFETPPL